MKKKLFFLSVLLWTVLDCVAQNPMPFYKGSTNVFTLSNAGTIGAAEESTNSPFEGSNHYHITYNNSAMVGAITAGFNINSTYKDISTYTHLIIAYKGTNSNGDIIKFRFYSPPPIDVYGTYGVTIDVNTAAYTIDTIPLSNFDGAALLDFTNVSKFLYQVNNTSTPPTSGDFWIDNIELYNENAPILSIKNNLFVENLRIYPNPAQNEIYVSHKNSLVGYHYSISNSIGNVLMEGNYSEKISLATLSKGLYYIKLEKEGEFFMEQIIVE